MEEKTENNHLVKKIEKKYDLSCCRSYLTPKGRCYTCPELDDEFALGGEKESEKDPDEEE